MRFFQPLGSDRRLDRVDLAAHVEYLKAENRAPSAVASGDEPDVILFPTGKDECWQRLGGLLKSYLRAA